MVRLMCLFFWVNISKVDIKLPNGGVEPEDDDMYNYWFGGEN